MMLVVFPVDLTQILSILAMLAVAGVVALALRRHFAGIRSQAQADARRSRILNDIPSELRFRVYERDGYTCQRCGTESDLLVDFVDAAPESGPVRLEHLATRCTRCAAIVRQSGIMHGAG